MNTLFVGSAYGRIYPFRHQVLEAWRGGKDFKIVNGPYMSVRDTGLIKDEGYDQVVFKGSFGDMVLWRR